MAAISLPLFKFKYVHKLLHVSQRTRTHKFTGLPKAECCQARHWSDSGHNKDEHTQKQDDNVSQDLEATQQKAKSKPKRKGFYPIDLELMDPTKLWEKKRRQRNRKLRQLQIEFEEKRRAAQEQKLREAMEQQAEEQASSSQVQREQINEVNRIRYERRNKKEAEQKRAERAETTETPETASAAETAATAETVDTANTSRTAETAAALERRARMAQPSVEPDEMMSTPVHKTAETFNFEEKEEENQTVAESGETTKSQMGVRDGLVDKLQRIQKEINLKQQRLKSEISKKQQSIEKAISETRRKVAEYGKKKDKVKEEPEPRRYDENVDIKPEPEKEHWNPYTPSIEVEFDSKRIQNEQSTENTSEAEQFHKDERRKPEVLKKQPLSRRQRVDKADAEYKSQFSKRPQSTPAPKYDYSIRPKTPKSMKETVPYNPTHFNVNKNKGHERASSENPAEESEMDESKLSNLKLIELELEQRRKNREESLQLRRRIQELTKRTKDSDERKEAAQQTETEGRGEDRPSDTKDYFNNLRLLTLKPKPVAATASGQKFLKSQYSAKDVQEHFKRVKHYLKDFPTALSFQGSRLGLDGVEIRYFSDDRMPKVEEPTDDMESRKIFEQNEEPYPSLVVAEPMVEDTSYKQLYTNPIKELNYRGYEIRSYCDMRCPSEPSDSQTRTAKRKNQTTQQKRKRSEGEFQRLTQTIKHASFCRDKNNVKTTDVEPKPLVPSTVARKRKPMTAQPKRKRVRPQNCEELEKEMERERTLKLEREKLNAQIAEENEELKKEHHFIARKRKPTKLHIKTKRVRRTNCDELEKELETGRKLKLEHEQLNAQMAEEHAELEKQHRVIVDYRRNRLQKQQQKAQEKTQQQAEPEPQPRTIDLKTEIKRELSATDAQLKQIREQVDRLIVQFQLDQQPEQARQTKTDNDDGKQASKNLHTGKIETTDGQCESQTADDAKALNHYSTDEFHTKQVDKLLQELMAQSGNTPTICNTAAKKLSKKSGDEGSKPVKHLTYVITQPIASASEPKRANAPPEQYIDEAITRGVRHNLKGDIHDELADAPSLTVRKENPQEIKNSLYTLTYASISDFLKSKRGGGSAKSCAGSDGSGTTSLVSPLILPNIASMQEFFRHPLTWEKNNGYLNLLVALGLLGYCLSAPNKVELEDAEYNIVDSDSDEPY